MTLNPELHLVESFDEAEAFMSWLGERRDALAVDTETGGLQWWKDGLRLVQFGDKGAGWAVPFNDWGGLVKEAFKRYDGTIVMHNAKFDTRFLERNGVAVARKNIDDTRIMAHLLNPLQPTGLKPLGVRHIDSTFGSGQEDLKRQMAKYRWTWATVPVDLPDYWVYSALDTVITAHLYDKFSTEVASNFRGVYELEMATTWVLMDMETRGARIDVEYCERKFDELTKYVDEMASWIDKEYGCGTSDRSIAAQLLKDGVRLSKKTATGQWCMDKEVLSEIDHPLANATLDRKAAQKIANTYFKNFLNNRDGDIVHPDVNSLGARTGRMSVKNPAVQTLPRGNIVREAFIAREDHKLVDQDYSQIEQRLLAHFANDKGMIDAFAEADSPNGEDFFTSLARQIFNDASIMKSDPRRQVTKNASYAKAYGAGPETFAHTAGIPLAEAQQFLIKYDQTFPNVRRWQNEVQNIAQGRLNIEGEAYVLTDWGRRLPGDEDALYALANFQIQGTASDVLKQKLVDMDSAGLSQYLVLPVHDELLFDVPEEVLDDAAPEMLKVMEELERFKVPLTCGQEIGMTWSEVH